MYLTSTRAKTTHEGIGVADDGLASGVRSKTDHAEGNMGANTDMTTKVTKPDNAKILNPRYTGADRVLPGGVRA